MPPVGWYGLVLAVAAGATAALCLPARWLSVKVGYVAQPADRKVHTRTTPYGGGAAMFLGFLVAMVVGRLHPGPAHHLPRLLRAARGGAGRRRPSSPWG